MRAFTASKSEAKFEEKIFAVNLEDPGSRDVGRETGIVADVGFDVSKIWEPMEPPAEYWRGKPLARTLTGRERESSKVIPL